MSNIVHNYGDFCFLSKDRLRALKTKATRSGAWFKALQRIDRVLFDLTIRVVVNIRSANLAKSIATLTRELENAIKDSFLDPLRTIGLAMAQRVSLTAQKLGNNSANNWEFDISFAIFLAATNIYNGEIFKC